MTVQAQNPSGVPINATVATNVSLSVKSGDVNALGGTISGTIPIGSNQLVINGVTYSKNDFGVVLKASATSGETLTPGDSAPFNVAIGSPTKLGFTFQPANSTTSGAIKGPPTVAVQDNAGNTITSSTAAITVAIGTNPGGGTLSGTTVRNAAGGTAAFADLHIDNAADGYTLTAISSGLTGATTSTFNITIAGNVSGTVTKSAGGGAITGALVEALQSGVVKGTASSNSSGSYTITGLVPGSYDIRGTAGGFTPQTQTGVTVNGGATATANFSLAAATPTAGIVYIYDELQRLKSVIDPVGEAATYTYDAVGNLLAIARNNATQTSVIDFNPNSGPIGSAVTIYGTGYSATPSQNTVTFNGVAATVISSTLTQIATTVPAGATTGPIAVISPAGSAASATAFTIGNSAAPTITGFTPTIGTIGTPVSIDGTNFDTTPSANSVRFNLTLGSVSAATSTSLSSAVPTLSGSGRISVTTKFGKVVSAGYLFVPPAPYTATNVESTGTITFGSDTTLTLATANNIALRVFEGVAGQIVTLNANNPTFGCGGMSVYILKPNNTQLSSVGICGNTYLDAVSLPVTGTYTVMLTSNGGTTGQATLTLNSVVDVTGTITADGTPVTASITTPGQRVLLTFSGTANQVVSLEASNATFGCFVAGMTILKPDSTQLVAGGICGGGGFIEPVTLPVTGSYTVVLDANSSNTGQTTLRLFTVVDTTGTITADGTPVTASITTPGQRVLLTFSGTANQVVSLEASNATFGCFAAGMTILKPDSTQLVEGGICGGGGFIEPVTLPVTGSYTVMLDANSSNTGQTTLELNTVP